MFCPSYRASPFGDYGYYDALARQHALEQRRRDAILLARQREAEREEAEQLALLRAQAYRREQIELARRRQAQLEAAELARRRHVYEEQRLRQAAMADAQRQRQHHQRRQYERAASIIQRAVRAHLAARPRHAQLDRIADDFASLKASFVSPSASECVDDETVQIIADFARSLVLTDNGSLAFVPANVPLRAHEEALTRLLTRLDAVDSAGDVRVRNHRRQLVLDIERELERLEALKTAARESAAAAANVATEATDDARAGLAEEAIGSGSDVGAIASDADGEATESAAPAAPLEVAESVGSSDTLVGDAAVIDAKEIDMASPARSRSPSLLSLASEDGYEIIV